VVVGGKSEKRGGKIRLKKNRQTQRGFSNQESSGASSQIEGLNKKDLKGGGKVTAEGQKLQKKIAQKLDLFSQKGEGSKEDEIP